MNYLSVINLTKKFFSKQTCFTAVNKVSFDLKEGEILGILGANGAGKTTTIHMLLSTLTPTSGSIHYFGKSLDTARSEVLNKVGYASTYAKLPPRLNMYDNLEIYGRLYGLSYTVRKERIEHYLRYFGLWHDRYKETGILSAGQTTRLVLAKALMHHPKVVLLDEPTASLDPDVAQDVRSIVLDQRKSFGTSFVFTSHNMEEVTQVCDRVLVLKQGQIIADSNPEDLARSVRSTYVILLVTEGLEHAIALAKEKELSWSVQEQTIKIEVDEQSIAHLLSDLAKHNVHYVSICIEHPSLEDYFLKIVRST
jgi:ABC-2 type transport system ATP-binding protein